MCDGPGQPCRLGVRHAVDRPHARDFCRKRPLARHRHRDDEKQWLTLGRRDEDRCMQQKDCTGRLPRAPDTATTFLHLPRPRTRTPAIFRTRLAYYVAPSFGGSHPINPDIVQRPCHHVRCTVYLTDHVPLYMAASSRNHRVQSASSPSSSSSSSVS
jgi:hypothetical protein